MTSTIYITLICLTFVGAATAGADWSYEDVQGWKDINANCGKKAQSPINIDTKNVETQTLSAFDYSKYTLLKNANLTNNGHTVQLSAKGPSVSGGGLSGVYNAVQLHFHWAVDEEMKGSEHAVDGTYYPLEMHIVHMSSKFDDINEALGSSNGLAVLGFFFQVGAKNDYLQNITPFADTVTKSGKEINEFDLKGLISDAVNTDNYFRYSGSLTTPPCSEAVVWTVYESPLTLSLDQLKKFWMAKNSKGMKFKNYRPVQSLNSRKIIKNSSGMSKAFSVLVVFSVVLSYFS